MARTKGSEMHRMAQEKATEDEDAMIVVGAESGCEPVVARVKRARPARIAHDGNPLQAPRSAATKPCAAGSRVPVDAAPHAPAPAGEVAPVPAAHDSIASDLGAASQPVAEQGDASPEHGLHTPTPSDAPSEQRLKRLKADRERKAAKRAQEAVHAKKTADLGDNAAPTSLNALATVCSRASSGASQAVGLITGAVTAVLTYVSPEKKPNWSSADDVRMIVGAVSPAVLPFLKKLGETGDRLNSQVSTSVSHVQADDQFFSALQDQFNDPSFLCIVPWTDAHLKRTEYRLLKRRDADVLRDAWFKMMSLFEDAWARYGRSGQGGEECYCLCGAVGFYTTSGVPVFARW